MRVFPVYGDYSQADPQREIVDAVADGRVDVAVIWGPLAGYYARREPEPMDIVPIADGPPVSWALVRSVAAGTARVRALTRIAAEADPSGSRRPAAPAP